MDAIPREYVEAELSRRVIGAFYETYNALAVRFRGQPVGVFRADFVLENKLIIELKAVERLMPAHESQLLNYLKATNIKLGLLLNFGPKAQIRRRVF